jgi:hypothetical protein
VVFCFYFNVGSVFCIVRSALVVGICSPGGIVILEILGDHVVKFLIFGGFFGWVVSVASYR